jgi:hypothetical protein
VIFLLFHSVLRFTHLELVLVRVLISYIPVVGVLRCFSPGTPALFLREGYVGCVTPCRILVVVPITSFLPSVRRLEFLFFGGLQGLSCSHSRKCWVSVHCGGQASKPQQSSGLPLSRVAGIPALGKKDMTLLQGGAV